MTKSLTFIICFVFLSFSGFSQTDKAYAETLNTMFKVAGTEASYKAVIQQMFVSFKQQYPQVEASLWDELETEFLQASLNDLTELLVPVYSKHLTKSDLEEIIEFYSTPSGKKFAQKTPLIMQESMQVGQQWGMKIGQKFQEKMKEKGY